MIDETEDDATDSDPTPRDAEEIAHRSIVLHCVVANAHGVSSEDILEWLSEERLEGELTPKERKFLNESEHVQKDVIWMTWMAEAQAALLWSIHKLDELPPLNEMCDTGLVVDAMPGLFESTFLFIESAQLRDAEEIIAVEAEVYDRRCQYVTSKGENSGSSSINPGVALFRHYGLSWVLRYCDQDWDDVTPDT